ncbi:HutD family protein [Pseudomonas sp. 2FE]|uniref:HutD/Ves family protein n=1 Tax=Pseudomonas sp. 2FE TaxID=2502190 RepID=UPI0010F84A82|nr:HutD family protein [Pseudomonas sp. 2FE]
MTQLRILRAADYPRMPWKNGAGSTLEIARDAGEGLEGFGWRLSIADVGESDGFSAFNGYQRIITVLEGAGMQLTVDGQLSRPLLALDAFAFSGDSRVECRLLDGPIRDFNLIYAPSRYSARLQWLQPVPQALQLFSSASVVLLFSALDGLRVQVEGEHVAELNRFDCLVLERDKPLLSELRLQAEVAGACALIELQPRR